MKTLRFISKDKTEFASVLRKNVNAYFKQNNISQKGNWKIVLKSIVMVSLYLTPFILLLTVSMYSWMIFPISFLIGIGMAGTGMAVMHDAAHGSSSNKNWLNKLLGGTIYLMGSNGFTWKMQHNVMHHTFTNIEGFDEDIEHRGVLRLCKHAPLKKVHRFQHLYAFFFYSLMTLSKMFKDFSQLYQYNKSGLTRQQNAKPRWEYTKMVLTKAIYLFIAIGFPLLFTSFAWWQVLLGFLITHFTAAIIMSIIFQMAHVVEGTEQPLPAASGHIENEWAIHQLQTTSNFARDNHLLGWFIGGLNFQIEHHLFPNVSHIHYRKLSLIVERTAQEFGIPYNLKPSFRHAIGSHYRTLRELGR